MHLYTDYPWYCVVLCLLLGAIYSFVLYYLPVGNKRPDFPRKVIIPLSILRFVVVSVLAFLLLAPLVSRQVREREKPLVIIAQDNSQSPILSKDSTYYRTSYADAMLRLHKSLADDYEVRSYSYGSQLSKLDGKPSYSELETDISSMLMQLGGLYEGRNVGAFIISGDGIYTHGADPVSIAHRYTFPIYTIALGDTTVQCDASLLNIRYNRETYVGRKFPLAITVAANRLKGERQRLTVEQRLPSSTQWTTLFTKDIAYTSNRFSTTETVLLSAEKAGMQVYRVSLTVADGEATSNNNSSLLHVVVRDNRQKIAIIAATPHPDVAALRRSIEKKDGYETSVFVAGDLAMQQGNWDQYDLVILHQLPHSASDVALCRSFYDAHVPFVHILGPQTDLKAFNTLSSGVTISTNLNNSVDATASVNRSFTHFALSQDVQNTLEQFPPLRAPFGDYHCSSAIQPLLYSKIGNIASDQPLVAVGNNGDVRIAFVFGEGLWRWSIQSEASGDPDPAFDQLLSQLVVYTTTQVKQNPLRVSHRDVYRADEHIVLGAEFYDQNMQLTNVPELRVRIKPLQAAVEEKPAEYIFTRTSSAYSANIGSLPEGSYSYAATTTFSGKTYSTNGTFMVSRVNAEETNLTANHSIMNTLAVNSGGRLAYPSDVDSIAEWLKARNDVKTVIHTHTFHTPLISTWWILVLIVLLMSTEWALRKYYQEV